MSFWLSEECEESFQTLKNLLTSALRFPLLEEGMDSMAYFDASRDGLGGMLM